MVETGLLSEMVINHDDRKKTNVIRVLIVDDHQVVREGLRRILELEEDIQIIGEAATGDEAIIKTVALSPDVVTMDLKMPGMDGIIATREIKQKAPDVDVLMLTLYSEDFIKEAISAGASGYLLKDSDCDQIVKAIRQVHNGLCPIAPSLTKELVTNFARLSNQSTILTERQCEVLRMVAEGVSSDEISSYLYISTSTVKREIRNILAKLNVSDRAQAVSEAIRRKLI
jgi:DNA-binding NarL/FixJ family response regulator